MPNWCEGNIRFRGSKKNIIECLRNEIVCSWLKAKPVETIVTMDEFEETVEVTGKDIDPASNGYLWIKDTNRNFLNLFHPHALAMLYDTKDEQSIAIFNGFHAAWSVIPSIPIYIEMSKNYRVDIRIVGFERGMEFTEDIEIVKGEIVSNNGKTYKNWYWECPMPELGG